MDGVRERRSPLGASISNGISWCSVLNLNLTILQLKIICSAFSLVSVRSMRLFLVEPSFICLMNVGPSDYRLRMESRFAMMNRLIERPRLLFFRSNHILLRAFASVRMTTVWFLNLSSYLPYCLLLGIDWMLFRAGSVVHLALLHLAALFVSSSYLVCLLLLLSSMQSMHLIHSSRPMHLVYVISSYAFRLCHHTTSSKC